MLDWLLLKLKCKIGGVFGINEKHITRKFFVKKGITIGENCCIYSNISTPESYLIRVGNNVTISNDVQFLTHDNSIDRLCQEKCDIFGEITIGNNCFIGARTVILPGVTLGNRTVVGAGSVVTKSFPDGVIVAGNPARQVGTVDAFLKKYSDIAFAPEDYAKGIQNAVEAHPDKVLRNR